MATLEWLLDRVMRFLAYLLLIAFGFGGLYLGIVGWAGIELEDKLDDLEETVSVDAEGREVTGLTYDGVTFETEKALEAYIEMARSERLFPWLHLIPDISYRALAACAFGMLGGVIRVTAKLSMDEKLLTLREAVLEPVFGMLMGFLIFAVLMLVPAVVVAQDSDVDVKAILGLSLLGGVFAEQAFMWLEAKAQGRFRKEISE